MAFEVVPYSPPKRSSEEGQTNDASLRGPSGKKSKLPSLGAIGPRLVSSDAEKATQEQPSPVDDQPDTGGHLPDIEKKPLIKSPSGKKDSKKSPTKKKSHLTRIK